MAVAQYVSFLPNAFLEGEVQALLSSASAAISPSRSLTRNSVKRKNHCKMPLVIFIKTYWGIFIYQEIKSAII